MTRKKPDRQTSSLFEEHPLSFGDRFLEDHLGPIIKDGKIATLELVANSYDAGSTKIEVRVPNEEDGEFSVVDNGTGMTRDQFLRRWGHLCYDRTVAQGSNAEFPPDVPAARAPRKALGRNGKGRFAPFCFADTYQVITARDGKRSTFEVFRKSDRACPFDAKLVDQVDSAEHGTTIKFAPLQNGVAPEEIASELAENFGVDPGFNVYVNGKLIEFLDPSAEPTVTVQVDKDIAHIHLMRIAISRPGGLSGVAWWVRKRRVGLINWDRNTAVGTFLDGRSDTARRLRIIVEADTLHDAVKQDWTGFHVDGRVNGFRGAVEEKIEELVSEFRKDIGKEKLERVMGQKGGTLQTMSEGSRRVVEEFVSGVIDRCPRMQEQDLLNTAELMIKMEESRSGYELLRRLNECTPNDLDRWNDIMTQWTARSAEIVLNELHRRLELISKLEGMVHVSTTDELHELQPLFQHGLWMFGPEFESVDFMSNRSIATSLRLLLGVTEPPDDQRRADFVVTADASIGPYALNWYDGRGEANGLQRVVLVELKRGGFKLTQKEMNQAFDYARAIRKHGLLRPDAKIDVYVLGASCDDVDELNSGTIRITPMVYDALLGRAHTRTFNLQRKLRSEQPRLAANPTMTSDLFPTSGS